MKIWKLSVVYNESLDWEASTYKGEVFVRAKTEDEARALATSSFCKAVKRVTNDTIINPWSQNSIVSCVAIDNSGYETEGRSEILAPQQ